MNKKSFQKPIAMALSLTMVCGLGGISALADQTEPVAVFDNGTEEQKTAAIEGNLIISEELGSAVAIDAEAYHHGDVSVGVENDVSVTARGYAQGAEILAAGDASAEVNIGGDLTSTSNERNAIGAETYAVGGANASLTVGGNVETAGEMAYGYMMRPDGAVSAISSGEGSHAEVEVKGNVSATAASTEFGAWGATMEAYSGGTSEITIGENLTATANNEEGSALGLGASVSAVDGTASLSVGGDVYATGMRAIGVSADAGSSHVYDEEAQSSDTVVVGGGIERIDIGGNVTAEGNGADGLMIRSYGKGSDVEASVNGSITARSESDDGHAIGAEIDVRGGETVLNVNGDIFADGVSGQGLSVQLDSFEDTAGLVTVQVGGDVSGQDTGLFVTLYGDNDSSAANVTVEGTLSAKSENGTAVVVSENVTPDNLKLTVWKVDLDKDGNAVTQLTDWTTNGKPITESTEVSKAIEANIEYIIKVEPTQADLFSGTQATAKEGENVAVKLTVPDGYKLNGAFTDEGKSVELLKDSDGNYYVVVPRGGGIYLSAKLEALPAETQAVSISYGNVGGVTMENGCYVLTLTARQPSFTFLRSTLEHHAAQNDRLVIKTEKGSCSQSISELLNLNEKAVNFRFTLTDEAVEIYLDGQMLKTIGMTDFV